MSIIDAIKNEFNFIFFLCSDKSFDSIYKYKDTCLLGKIIYTVKHFYNIVLSILITSYLYSFLVIYFCLFSYYMNSILLCLFASPPTLGACWVSSILPFPSMGPLSMYHCTLFQSSLFSFTRYL